MLFNVWIVCFTLIVGGAVLLWIDRLDLQAALSRRDRSFTLPMYLDHRRRASASPMIPGVSRSGATIVGAMLLGADRRSAAEFSFWLAMPTMVGAFAYELYKSRARDRAAATSSLIAVGFVVVVHLRLDRGEDVPRLRAAPRLRAVRLVAHRRRRARPDRDLRSGSGVTRAARLRNCPVLRKRQR